MKQPYNTTIYNTALYMRLSRDDELQGESGSIQTQRMMLRQYAAEHGLNVIDEYIDDTAIMGLNRNQRQSDVCLVPLFLFSEDFSNQMRMYQF